MLLWSISDDNHKIQKVNGEMSLIMIVYSIKRTINILGLQNLIANLIKWTLDYKKIGWLNTLLTYFKQVWGYQKIKAILLFNHLLSVNRTVNS